MQWSLRRLKGHVDFVREEHVGQFGRASRRKSLFTLGQIAPNLVGVSKKHTAVITGHGMPE